jgi:hypothetical protein
VLLIFLFFVGQKNYGVNNFYNFYRSQNNKIKMEAKMKNTDEKDEKLKFLGVEVAATVDVKQNVKIGKGGGGTQE